MALVIIAVLFALALFGLARSANVRFRLEDRLPMQWWLDGNVTWSAPRPVALAFIPTLAIGVLLSFVVLSLCVQPRLGQEGMVVPALIGIGALFVVIQLLHVWMIDKTLRRNGS